MEASWSSVSGVRAACSSADRLLRAWNLAAGSLLVGESSAITGVTKGKRARARAVPKPISFFITYLLYPSRPDAGPLLGAIRMLSLRTFLKMYGLPVTVIIFVPFTSYDASYTAGCLPACRGSRHCRLPCGTGAASLIRS